MWPTETTVKAVLAEEKKQTALLEKILARLPPEEPPEDLSALADKAEEAAEHLEPIAEHLQDIGEHQ